MVAKESNFQKNYLESNIGGASAANNFGERPKRLKKLWSSKRPCQNPEKKYIFSNLRMKRRSVHVMYSKKKSKPKVELESIDAEFLAASSVLPLPLFSSLSHSVPLPLN